MGTEMYFVTPKISIDAATPANSATVFAMSTTRPASITKNVDRKPNSSRIKSESPFPVTTPMRAHISSLTYSAMAIGISDHSMAIVFFIIVCTAATLHASGQTHVATAEDAARALGPLAGKFASSLFAFGLLNASLFAASILPLSTAHVICEGLGFEAGIDHKMREAPIFYGLYTALIVIGGAIILIPRAPLFKIAVLSQVGNGIWLPIVLIFVLLLVNRRSLMGKYVNGRAFNVIAWTISIAMILLTLVFAYAAIVNPSAAGLG